MKEHTRICVGRVRRLSKIGFLVVVFLGAASAYSLLPEPNIEPVVGWVEEGRGDSTLTSTPSILPLFFRLTPVEVSVYDVKKKEFVKTRAFFPPIDVKWEVTRKKEKR